MPPPAWTAPSGSGPQTIAYCGGRDPKGGREGGPGWEPLPLPLVEPSSWIGEGEPCPSCCLHFLLFGAGLDAYPGHPSRLLRLNGAPQALSFCSNSGDLVLALGSRLCLVSHRLYLPTSYMIKVCSENRVCGWGCCRRQAP